MHTSLPSARSPRRNRQAGFSFIEILVVMGIITLLTSMVVVVIPMVRERASITKSKDNVKNLLTMMLDISANKLQGKYPGYNGKNFVLSPLAYGSIQHDAPGALDSFFSPGDVRFTLEQAGRDRYKEISKATLKAGQDYHELTSYAGRKNGDSDCLIYGADQSDKGTICICDDDEGPIHHASGLVVGFAGGRVEMMDWDEVGMTKPSNPKTPDPFLGESGSEILRCMSSK